MNPWRRLLFPLLSACRLTNICSIFQKHVSITKVTFHMSIVEEQDNYSVADFPRKICLLLLGEDLLTHKIFAFCFIKIKWTLYMIKITIQHYERKSSHHTICANVFTFAWIKLCRGLFLFIIIISQQSTQNKEKQHWTKDKIKTQQLIRNCTKRRANWEIYSLFLCEWFSNVSKIWSSTLYTQVIPWGVIFLSWIMGSLCNHDNDGSENATNKLRYIGVLSNFFATIPTRLTCQVNKWKKNLLFVYLLHKTRN